MSKGMATTKVHWLLLSCYTFKWSKDLLCKWKIMASLMVPLKLRRQLFILGMYRDTTSFSQGNFPSSQNPDTTSFQPVNTPQFSVPCSTTSSKTWTVMTNVYCCLQQLDIWAWNIWCTQSLELKVFGSAFWISHLSQNAEYSRHHHMKCFGILLKILAGTWSNTMTILNMEKSLDHNGYKCY